MAEHAKIPSDFKVLEQSALGLRKLRSPGANRVLAGLKAAADANGLPDTGRFIDYGDERPALPGQKPQTTIVLGHTPGHPGEANYLAAFPPASNPKE
jgi:hypothetical protein